MKAERPTGPDLGAGTPWNRDAEVVARELDVSPDRGLTEAEVTRRRERHGPNTLRSRRRERALAILVRQFRGLIVALLAAAAVASVLFGEWVEGAVITMVLVLNALIGFFSELRAVRSMEALRQLGQVRTRVRRDGRVREVPADQLVPGDIVPVEAGDVVTADLRLLTTSKLQADEAALTGESMPVSKRPPSVSRNAAIHERRCMLFKGTAITRGAGEGVVVATGMTTELGSIARLVEEAEQEVTPLERRLEALGNRLIRLTLVVAAATTALGLLSGKPVLLMIETGIALAVAAIPEGLPIVATMALARGMQRMARRNALVNRLSAVEVLGATTVILTDKTGTLTRNRMALKVVTGTDGDVSARDSRAREAVEIATLCNNASDNTGDPLEIALLEAGRHFGLTPAAKPRIREEAFDPSIRMMGTVHDVHDNGNGRLLIAVKGAPEAVLAASNATEDERRAWRERNEALARAGLRVLAVARRYDSEPDSEPERVRGMPIYSDLEMVGLLGLLDPPRDDVRAAVQACQRAGIRVIMVTGDQATTARNIGVAAGLVDDESAPVTEGRELARNLDADPNSIAVRSSRLYARVDPEQKLRLVQAHQQAGAIVAMTGDGVNDAPALKKADIGIAMGQRGTQVAREAADMVLKDDAFSSIVAAVREGRIIFGNIRKFAVYLLSCNVGEVLVVASAAVVQAPLPLLPLQLLFLNLVTDVFPALALAFGEGDTRIMEQPPRPPDEPLLTRRHWRAIAGHGFWIAASVMTVFGIAIRVQDRAPTEAVTISFLTVAFAQLWLVFAMRAPGSPRLRNDVTRNPWVHGALVLCIALLLAAVYVAPAAHVLQLTPPDAAGWLLITIGSVVPLAVSWIRVRVPATA